MTQKASNQLESGDVLEIDERAMERAWERSSADLRGYRPNLAKLRDISVRRAAARASVPGLAKRQRDVAKLKRKAGLL